MSQVESLSDVKNKESLMLEQFATRLRAITFKERDAILEAMKDSRNLLEGLIVPIKIVK